MKLRLTAAALAIGAAAIAFTVHAQKGPDSGPVARYDMRAGTVSGMGGMGGGRPNMMSMLTGGGGSKVQHELYLRLGSSNVPPAKAKAAADHFMPPSANLGKSVALATPVQEKGPVDEVPNFSERGQEPTGRILIFWGCGEHAPKGQPFVLDLNKLYHGQVPAADSPWAANIPADWGPSLSNSKTFGRWPAEDGKYAKSDTSLPGAHRVAGNYSPEINFTLSKDFMQALAVSVAGQKSGASLLSWPAVPDTTGLVATIFGSKQGPNGQMGDLVMWSSSASRQFGGGLSDWLSPSQAASLVSNKTLLPGAATQCLVPAEVVAAAPDFRMGTLTAFGPEEDFSYPPRPAATKARWDLQWTARIRHRSTASWMEAQGMSMGTANGDDADYQEQAGQQAGQQSGQPADKKKKCKKKGGLFGGVVGAVTGIGGGDC